eukprot:6305073-Pyramimonas_sp.AAC.1
MCSVAGAGGTTLPSAGRARRGKEEPAKDIPLMRAAATQGTVRPYGPEKGPKGCLCQEGSP